MTTTAEATRAPLDQATAGARKASFAWGSWLLLAAGLTTALALIFAPDVYHPSTGWFVTIVATWITAALLTAVPWGLAIGIAYWRHQRKNRQPHPDTPRTPADRVPPAADPSPAVAQGRRTEPVASTVPALRSASPAR